MTFVSCGQLGGLGSATLESALALPGLNPCFATGTE